MSNYLDFYERVKNCSKEQNRTVRSVIESCNINYDSYNSYKRYGNLPRTDEAIAIAETLGTTVEFLVTGKLPTAETELMKLKNKILEFAKSVQ